jgi:hypothetical protein
MRERTPTVTPLPAAPRFLSQTPTSSPKYPPCEILTAARCKNNTRQIQLSACFKPYPECPFPNKSQRIAATDDASHHLSSQPTAQHHQLFPSLQMHNLPIPCSFVIQDQIYIAGSRRAPTPPVVSPSRLARPPAWGLRSWGWDKLLGYL